MEYVMSAAGLPCLDTAAALREAGRASQGAVNGIESRLDEWQAIMNESADGYQNTDVDAAHRLAGLGDFNRPERGFP
nr:type VII secretion target [Gordonia sputi]